MSSYRRRRLRRRYARMSSTQQRAAAVIIGGVILFGVTHKHPPPPGPPGESHAAHLAHLRQAAAGAPPAAITTSRTVGGGEDAFIRALLADIGAPATPANTSSLASWFTREFPSWPPAATNNPMATTQDEPGATIYNSVGVKNYPAAAEGVQANATALENGYYPRIVVALRNGQGLCGSGLASEFNTWSGNGYAGVC